jgi:hypothetical protein
MLPVFGPGVIWNGIHFERPVVPAKAGIQSEETAYFRTLAGWIPALRQAQGKLFAGMTAACTRPRLASDTCTRWTGPGLGRRQRVNRLCLQLLALKRPFFSL